MNQNQFRSTQLWNSFFFANFVISGTDHDKFLKNASPPKSQATWRRHVKKRVHRRKKSGVTIYGAFEEGVELSHHRKWHVQEERKRHAKETSSKLGVQRARVGSKH